MTLHCTYHLIIIMVYVWKPSWTILLITMTDSICLLWTIQFVQEAKIHMVKVIWSNFTSISYPSHSYMNKDWMTWGPWSQSWRNPFGKYQLIMENLAMIVSRITSKTSSTLEILDKIEVTFCWITIGKDTWVIWNLIQKNSPDLKRLSKWSSKNFFKQV